MRCTIKRQFKTSVWVTALLEQTSIYESESLIKHRISWIGNCYRSVYDEQKTSEATCGIERDFVWLKFHEIDLTKIFLKCFLNNTLINIIKKLIKSGSHIVSFILSLIVAVLFSSHVLSQELFLDQKGEVRTISQQELLSNNDTGSDISTNNFKDSRDLFIFGHRLKMQSSCDYQSARIQSDGYDQSGIHIDKTILLGDLRDTNSEASKLLKHTVRFEIAIEIRCFNPRINPKDIALLRQGIIDIVFFSERVSSDRFCESELLLMNVCSHLAKFNNKENNIKNQYVYHFPYYDVYVSNKDILNSAISLPLFFVRNRTFDNCFDSGVNSGAGSYTSPGFFFYDDVTFGATFQPRTFISKGGVVSELIDNEWISFHQTIVTLLKQVITKKE